MIGETFGRWTVIGTGGPRRWVCRCECGAQATVFTSNLKRGLSRSCGCAPRRPAPVKHGHTANGETSREYRVWSAMIARCHNPHAPNFSLYGGRGITVCDRWRVSFEAFLADVGPRPAGASIDRIDNDRGYEPGNCRWATAREQASNRRNNHRVTLGGETRTITEWARMVGISDTAFLARLRRGETAPAILRPSTRAHSSQASIFDAIGGT